MYSLKEKVTEKLSRLLADAQPHDSIQTNSPSKGLNTRTSLFSFIHPSSSSSKTEDLKPLQSDPVRWSSKGRASRKSEYKKAECISREECRESASSCAEQEISASSYAEQEISTSSTCALEMCEDAVEPQSSLKLMPNLTSDSSFIYVELYEFLQSSLPNIVKGCQWVLLYRAVL